MLSRNSQSQENPLGAKITQAFIEESSPAGSHQKRRMMFTKTPGSKRHPAKVVFGSLMFLYQNVFSEQISAQCMYEISCSEYTKLNIEKNGLILGSILGFHQLMHCTPGTVHEVPPYMYTVYSTKIANHVHPMR